MKNLNMDDGGEISNFIIDRESKKVKPETLLSKEVDFDTPKKINRSEIKVSEEVINEIENTGVSIEKLESFGLPVYKYKTQITIHGDFDGIVRTRVGIGGYKNLIINQNKTLGVKYNAIDASKKKLIAESLKHFSYKGGEKYENRRFRVDYDSTGFRIVLRKSVANKEGYPKILESVKNIYNEIPDIFIGTKDVYSYNIPFYGIVVELMIQLNAIREGNLWKFISILTDGFISSMEELQFYINEKENEYKELIARQQSDKDEKMKSYFLKKEEFLKNNPFPVMEKIPSSDEFAYGFIVNSSYEPKFRVVYVYKGSFNRLFYYTEVFNDFESVVSVIDKTSNKHRKVAKDLIKSVTSKLPEKSFYIINAGSEKQIPKSKIVETKIETTLTPNVSEGVLVSTDLYDFTKSKHTKTNEDLYIVKLKQDIENFNVLKSNFSKIKGYYSSYVKGFIVKDNMNKESLDALFDGVVFKNKKGLNLNKELAEISEKTEVPLEQVKKELDNTVGEEEVHRENLEKLQKGEITVDDALKGIVIDHMKEEIDKNNDNKKPIYIEYIEDIEKEDYFVDDLEQLTDEIKKSGFSNNPLSIYKKAKVKIDGYPSFIIIRFSKQGSDYFDFENEKLIDYLKRYDNQFDWSKYEKSVPEENEDLDYRKKMRELNARLELVNEMLEETPENTVLVERKELLIEMIADLKQNN